VDIKEVGESNLIQRIADNYRSSRSSVIIGIGDDAAALTVSSQNVLLTTCDLLVEDVHFNLSFTDSYYLGRKALAVNLSDIAAMGGTARYFLVSLALPSHLSLAFVDDLYRGMMELADEFHTQLVGGDTNASPLKLMISITVLGEAHPDNLLKRSGAQVGDSIFVTGTLGDAALGLLLLQNDPPQSTSATVNALTSRHLSPYPRLKEGKKLADNQLASAMIDISDGLLTDLGRILTASNKGATVFLSQLPRSKDFEQNHRYPEKTKFDCALGGGEDYELLFTAHPSKEKELYRLGTTGDVPITKIGEVNASQELVVLDYDQNPYPVTHLGYDHFLSMR
jgi:thiamine-monophosphate kinase